MEFEFSNLSLEQLTNICEDAEYRLNEALLNGSLWEDVQDKRALVTRLAHEVWKKRQELQFSSPAENNARGGSGNFSPQ